ncbi:MAG: hypothetical protein ACRC9L_01150 [Brevinema sp.]
MTISDLERLHTVPVLRTVSSVWQNLISFQADFLQFPDSRLLLNFLVFNQGIALENVPRSFISTKELDNTNADLKILLKIWDTPLTSLTLQRCMDEWSHEIVLSPEQIFNYDLYITQLQKSRIDPLIQLYGFVYRTWKITKGHPNQERIIRIMALHFLKELGVLREPIFYPDNFLIIGKLFDIFKNPVMDDVIIIYLNQFERICDLGSLIIGISKQKIAKLMETMQSKVEDNEDIFFFFCSHVMIDIPQLMKIANWKRDKAARFLNSLSKEGIFLQKKIGTQKLFINAGLMDIFIEIRDNPQIKKMMTPSLFNL